MSFRYILPPERIAQRPIARTGRRSDSRLLVADASRSPDVEFHDDHVFNIARYLKRGDRLVLNDTRVVPSRFFVQAGKGSGVCELFILHRRSDGLHEALARPMDRFIEGDSVALSPELDAVIHGRTKDGGKLLVELKLNGNCSAGSIETSMERAGSMPIPPYIRKGKSDEFDRTDYQTTYAKNSGSIAAPTAGLHFTPELLDELRSFGVDVTFITLHVGAASFLPVLRQDPDGQRVEGENFIVTSEAWGEIIGTKQAGGRVVAVGTTTVRTLESLALKDGVDADGHLHTTELFITPGFDFKIVDVLVTNFHQPGSTHILLVAAFFGNENIARAYDHALSGEYRFLSYGDSSMLIPPSRENGL